MNPNVLISNHFCDNFYEFSEILTNYGVNFDIENYYDKKTNPNYIESFKIARKKKNSKNFDYIFSISENGETLGISSKSKGSWKFWKCDEQVIIQTWYLLEKYKRERKINRDSYIAVSHTITPFIDYLAKQYNVKVLRKNEPIDCWQKKIKPLAVFDEDLKVSIFSNKYSASDSLTIWCEIFKQTEIHLNKILEKIYEKYNMFFYYINNEYEYTKEEYSRGINNLESLKTLSDFNIKENRLVHNDKKWIIYKTTFQNITIFNQYDKEKKIAYLKYVISGSEESQSYYDRKKIVSLYEKALDEKRVNKPFFSTVNGQIILLTIGLIALGFMGGYIAFLAFSYPNILLYSFTPYLYMNWEFYYLFALIIISPILVAIPLFIIFKAFYRNNLMTKKPVFWDFLVVTYVSKLFQFMTPYFFIPLLIMYWYLKYKGYKSIESAAAISIQFIFLEFLAWVLNIIVMFYGMGIMAQSPYTNQTILTLIYVSASIGALITTLFILIPLFLTYSRHFQSFVLRTSEYFNFNVFKTPEKFAIHYDTIKFTSDKTRDHVTWFFKKPRELSMVAGAFVVWWLYWITITYTSILLGTSMFNFYLSSITNGQSINANINYLQTAGYGGVVWYAYQWLPIPGKSTSILPIVGAAAFAPVFGNNPILNVIPNTLGVPVGSYSPIGTSTTSGYGSYAVQTCAFYYNVFSGYIYGVMSLAFFSGVLILKTIKKNKHYN